MVREIFLAVSLNRPFPRLVSRVIFKELIFLESSLFLPVFGNIQAIRTQDNLDYKKPF